MTAPSDEHAIRRDARARVAEALWDLNEEWFGDDKYPEMFEAPPEATREPYWKMADAVLAALGLERVPNLAISVTDEHIEGVPFGIHQKPGDPFCGDESICAEHEPVFRIVAPSRRVAT